MAHDPINFLLVGELAVVIIVTSAFLFYWNRLLASVTAFCIRIVTWRVFHAHIDIGSLQISPLAGRLSFRDIQYHSSNISVRALHGHITWRYWLLRVRQEEDSQSSNVKRNRLPCRIAVHAEGVEMFVYNRTPAYDAIVDRMKKHEMQAKELSPKSSFDTSSGYGTATESGQTGARLRRSADDPVIGFAHQQRSGGTNRTDQANGQPSESQRDLSCQPTPESTPIREGVNWFREALPMEVDVTTGSIILGSDATPMILIGDFKTAAGLVEISNSRSKCDLYKLTTEFRFEEPKVLMRSNVDYSGPILAHGKKVYEELVKQEPQVANQPPSMLSTLLGFRAVARRFPFLHDSKFSSPPVHGLPQDRVWKGLARYRSTNEALTKMAHREDREYAKATTLLEAPALDFTYYADAPGLVPYSLATFIDKTDELGNGDSPPEYGMDIIVHGGLVKYGPWADRQRNALQIAFAPSIFFDSEPKTRLTPGETRLHPSLNLQISFSEETILRIPTKEASKDWMYDGVKSEPDRRYGWLDVAAGPNSSITYTQSQFATEHGYDAMLVLHLDSLQISSSVNLDTFIRSKSCKLSMTMPTPLRWDARRDWGLDIVLDEPDVTLLRDHCTLISDLARDWSSGAAGDFHHFIPNHYNFRVTLINYAIHLFVNDYNIIDKPRSRTDNAFVDLSGQVMEAYFAVAATQYRPEFSTVPFTVQAKDARLELSVPTWDTHRAFGDSDLIEVGRIGDVKATGSYRYYGAPRPDHQETLALHLEGKNVAFKALGWVIRRMFCIKDNYFGGFTQFTTMQEFLERFDHDPNSVGDPVEEKYRPGRSDPYAVNVTMNVEDSLILLSDQIYGCESGLVVPVPHLQMALKSIEHFMELSLDAAPTYVVASKDLATAYAIGQAPSPSSAEGLFVEGIELKANRLFGPQPRAETYLCLWECTLPRVSAFLSPDLLAIARMSIEAVAYNFRDIDNAPSSIYIPKSLPDVTFFKLSVESAEATFFTDTYALKMDLPGGIMLDSSSLASRHCSSMLSILASDVTIHLLRHDVSRHKWEAVGHLATDLVVDLYKAPHGWEEQVAAQQMFLKEQDILTKRIWYMYREGTGNLDGQHVNGIYMSQSRSVARDNEEVDSSEEGCTDEIYELNNSSAHSSETETLRDARATRLQRRSTSFVTANGSPTNSAVGDESDTESSASTSSTPVEAEHVQQYDLAGALAEKLQIFHQFTHRLSPRQRKSVYAAEPPVSRTPGIAGNLLRVANNNLTIDLTPISIQGALVLAQAVRLRMRTLEPESILDSLLVHQIDKISVDPWAVNPLQLNIEIPHANIRLLSEIPATMTEPHIAVSAHGLSSSYCRPPLSEQPTIDMTVSLRRMETALLILPTGGAEMTLRDIIPDSNQTSNKSAVFNAVLSNIRCDLTQYLATRQIHGKLGDCTIHMATSAIRPMHSIGFHWIGVLPSSGVNQDRPTPTAQLLIGLVHSVFMANLAHSLPSFAYESAYGLHVDDQRNVRKDTGWAMLARLRHWLRSVKMPQSEELTPRSPADYVVTQLASCEEGDRGDDALLRRQPFLQKAFPTALGLKNENRPEGIEQLDVFIFIDVFGLYHHGHLLESRTIGTTFTRIASASLGLQQGNNREEDGSRTRMNTFASIKDIETEVQNSFISMANSVLLMTSQHVDTKHNIQSSSPSPVRTEDRAVQLVSLSLGQIRTSLLVGGLRLSATLKGGLGTLSRELGGLVQRSGSPSSYSSLKWVISAMIPSVELVLSKSADEPQPTTHNQDRVVISLTANGVRMASETAGTNDIRPARILMGLNTVEFDSRPQLRAFYDFASGWAKQHWPIYKPTIEQISTAMVQRPVDATPNPVGSALAKIDLAIGAAHLQIRAAKALWLRWEIGKVFVTSDGSLEDLRFGIRIAPQVVGAYASVKRSNTRDSSSLRLPTFTATGTYRSADGHQDVSASVQLGLFIGILKPAILDRLLSLHQQLGSDMVTVAEDYQTDIHRVFSSRQEITSQQTKDARPSLLSVDLRLRVDGVRFGLMADDVATTLLFEALVLRGNLSNRNNQHGAMMWGAKAEHVGLSLGHLGTTVLSEDIEPTRKHRSAYMVIDVDVQEIPADDQSASRLNINLSRAHTVMHVAALSELTDLIKSWQADIHYLNDNRATEVTEVRAQTTRIFQKLDVTERPAQPENSWFASRFLQIEITGIGVAIPLTEGAAIDLQQGITSSTPALLFSIRLVSFQNRRNETARVQVKQSTLQFLEAFDQGVSEHFTGDFHSLANCMSLPSVDSQAQMKSTPDDWTLSAHCSATDFKLSLNPDIASGLYKLIDLYKQGKNRVSELENQYRAEIAKRDTLHNKADVSENTTSPKAARRVQRIFVRMSFTFNEGIVELHRAAATPMPKPKANMRGRSEKSGAHDTITLPTVSVWMRYIGSKTGALLASDVRDDTSILTINSAVLASSNVLRPSILPFVIELRNRLKARTTQKQSTTAPLEQMQQSESNMIPGAAISVAKVKSSAQFRVHISLRIDKSRLRLSCAPDSSAYVDIKWESGGFIASTTLGVDGTSTLAGSVSDVTATLSHEFAERGRGCLEAGAKDMAFSMSLCPGSGNDPRSGLSIVLDTQIKAQFRLEAYSAWLIFTSVWIDNSPKPDLPVQIVIPEGSSTVPVRAYVTPPNTRVVALVRLRSIDFDADISVSDAVLSITPVVLRVLTDGEETEVDLQLGVTQVVATGDISGSLRSESIHFNTLRRSSRASSDTNPSVLVMSIEAGDLSGYLFLEDVNIVRLHLDPSTVTLADDWQAYAADPLAHVFLAFAVKMGKFYGVLRLLAIPRLLGDIYSILDIVEIQQKIAAQRSEVYKEWRTRKSTEPSPVAAIIVQTARRANASTSMGNASHVKTAQTMRFDLSGIDIGLYNEDYEDGNIADFYRFEVGKVEADLKRQLSKEELPDRDLSLLVSYVRWDTSDGARCAAQEIRQMTAKDLIDRSTRMGRREVVSLPLMTLTMRSLEIPSPTTIEYDFDLIWGRTEGDVGIMPNFFEQAYKATVKLIDGVNEQESARVRKFGIAESPVTASKEQEKQDEQDEKPLDPPTELIFRNRDATQAQTMPIPRLKLLGQGTSEAARLIPKIKAAVVELPKMSHRFVTSPLEEGMDLLLKLYEKQLPDGTA